MEVEGILHDDHKAAEWLRSFERTLGCEGMNRDANGFALQLIVEAEGYKANLSYLKMRNAVTKELGDGASIDEIEARMAGKYGMKYQEVIEAIRRRDELKKRLKSVEAPVRKDGGVCGGVSPVLEEGLPAVPVCTSTDSKTTKKKFGQFQNVLLSDDEFEKWSTHANAEGLLEELSCFLASSGKKYKSHYATLLNWERRRKVEEAPKKKFLTTEEISRRNYEQSQQVLNRIMEERRHG
jgi:hypothetical protein